MDKSRKTPEKHMPAAKKTKYDGGIDAKATEHMAAAGGSAAEGARGATQPHAQGHADTHQQRHLPSHANPNPNAKPGAAPRIPSARHTARIDIIHPLPAAPAPSSFRLLPSQTLYICSTTANDAPETSSTPSNIPQSTLGPVSPSQDQQQLQQLLRVERAKTFEALRTAATVLPFLLPPRRFPSAHIPAPTPCAMSPPNPKDNNPPTKAPDGLHYKQYDVKAHESRYLPLIRQLISKDLSEPYSIYVYRYFLYQWADLCFMALDRAGGLVGVIVCKLEPHRSGPLRGYIAMLAVSQQYRGHGIATALVRRAIDEMRARDADEVALETEVSNTPSLRLYERLGFLRSKRLHRYYLNGNAAFRLILYLKPGVDRIPTQPPDYPPLQEPAAPQSMAINGGR